MSNEVKHWHVTYNDIHNLIRKCTPKIASEFNPDLLLAIGMFFTLLFHLFMFVVTGIPFRWRVSSSCYSCL
jgi:uncharacterized protein